MNHITSVEQLKAGEYYALRKKNQTALGAIYMCRKSEEKNDAYIGAYWAEELFMTCTVVGPIPHPDFDAIVRSAPEETVESLRAQRDNAMSHLKLILQWIKEPASGMDDGMLMGEQLKEAWGFIAKMQGGGE